MASVEEVARLIVEAESKGFAEADAKIKGTEASLAALTASYKAGGIPLEAYLTKGARLQGELDQLRDGYKIADEALKKHGSTQAATAALTHQFSASTAQARVRMQGLAYAMNDFFGASGGFAQRLNAIGNNLPQLFAGLGPKLAGFGLALGAIAPIIGVVIQNWETLGPKVDAVLSNIIGNKSWALLKSTIAEAFGSSIVEAKDHLESLKEKVKTLDEKPIKLAIDYANLEVARRELDNITAGLALAERLSKKQQEPEKKAGEQVTEALEGAEGGFAKVKDELKAHKAQALLNDDADLKATYAAIGETKRQIKAAEDVIANTGWFEAGGETKVKKARERIKSLNADLDQLEENRTRQQTDVTRSGGKADQEINENLRGAVEGKGTEQDVRREALAKDLEAIGRKDLAAQVRAAKTQEQSDEEDKDFERHMDRAKAAGERRRAVDKRKQAALEEGLRILLKSNVFNEENDEAAKEINKRGLGAIESFEELRSQIQARILAKLREHGLDSERAEKIAAKAADTEAEQAFGRVGRAGQKEERAAAAAAKKKAAADAKAGKKEAKDEFDDQAKELETQSRQAKARAEAEARRVKAAAPHAANAFAQAAAANPLADPQQLAAQVAAQMVMQFKRLLGASQAGAQVAAQHAAGEAGFSLTIAEIRDAQAQMLGRRGLRAGQAHPGMLSVSATETSSGPAAARAPTPAAGARGGLAGIADRTVATAALRQGVGVTAPGAGDLAVADAVIPDHTGRRRRAPAIRPRRKPRVMAIGATSLARPPGAQKAQVKLQQAAIAGYDRAKAQRQLNTRAQLTNAVASQDTAAASRAKAGKAAVDAAKAAQAARQQAAQAAQRRTLQAAGYPAGPDATPAVVTTQQAVATTNQAMRVALATQARVQQDAQTLLRQSSQLLAQARDMGTALNNPPR